MRKPIKRKPIVDGPVPAGLVSHAPKQISQALNISMSSTWRVLKSGKLKSFKVGHGRRVTTDALIAFQNAGGE